MTLFDEFRALGVVTSTGRILPTPEDAAIFRDRLARLMRATAPLDIECQMRALKNACGDFLEIPPISATSEYLNRRRRELAELEP